MAVAPEFINAHRFYVKSLYKRYLVNSLNWTISRDIWREKAIEIRAEFERNRNITDPRALAIVLEQAEKRLADERHPDPYRVPTSPDGTKWERNLPPPPNAFFPKHHHEPEPVVDVDELLQNKWANLRQIAEAVKGKKFTEPGSDAAEPPKAPQ